MTSISCVWITRSMTSDDYERHGLRIIEKHGFIGVHFFVDFMFGMSYACEI